VARCSAWPTLRAHALALAAETGEHPLRHMLRAASEGDLGTADDMAAVLDWRLTALTPTDPGPLPWLPGLPSALHDHPVWGGYLAKRSQLVADLADQVQDHACRGAASQPGHRREVTRACRSSAKLQCGVPPTASIPKTRDQPEEAANSVQQPPSGNSDSTGTPPVPRIRQAPRDMTNDTQHTPH
jgi:hypothetical protein